MKARPSLEEIFSSDIQAGKPQQARPTLEEIFSTSAETEARPEISQTRTEDVLSGITKGVAGLLSTPKAMSDIGKMAEKKVAEKIPGFQVPPATPIGMAMNLYQFFPTFEQTLKALKGAGAVSKEPRDVEGQYIQTISEFAAGNPTRKAFTFLGNLVGGLLSETAGQATKGTENESIARLLAGVFGSGVTEMAGAIRDVPASVLAKRIRDIDPEEFKKAKELQTVSQNIGVPLTGAEAIDSPALQALAGNIAVTPEGQPIMESFLKKRTGEDGQIARAVNKQLESIAPQQRPQALSTEINKAAAEVIKATQDARKVAAKPFYDQAFFENGSPKRLKDSISSGAELFLRKESKTLSSLKKDKLFREYSNDVMQDPVTGSLSDDNIAFIDSVRSKVLLTMRDLEAGGNKATQEYRQHASLQNRLAKIIDDNLDQKSKIALQQAREVYTEAQPEIANLLGGSIGELAKGAYNPAQVQKISKAINIISNTTEIKPQEIKQIAKDLNSVNKTIMPRLVRTYLGEAFDKASQELVSGDPRGVGVKFRKAIYGTPQQKQNMRALIMEVAKSNGENPSAFWTGFDNMLNVLERTSRIPGAGSPTQPRQQLSRELSRSTVAGTLETISTSPLAPIADFIREGLEGRRSRQLAKILTSSDSAHLIEKLAKLDPASKKARALVSQILLVTREAEKE